jgi:hypothetical protein
MFQRLLLMAGFAALMTISAPAKDASFEGRWVIDKSASTANFEIPDDLSQRIKVKGSDVSVQTTWREPKNGIAPLPLLGIMVNESKLTADGQEQRNQVGPFVQLTKTTIEGAQIVTEYTAASEEGEGKSVAGRWTRTLSPDGKQMFLEINQNGAGQNAEARLVFKKK